MSRFESYGCWFGEIAGVQILESSVRREETMCSILKMLLGEARVLLPRESAADVNSDSTTLRAGPAVVFGAPRDIANMRHVKTAVTSVLHA